jgi:hypothetical protein
MHTKRNSQNHNKHYIGQWITHQPPNYTKRRRKPHKKLKINCSRIKKIHRKKDKNRQTKRNQQQNSRIKTRILRTYKSTKKKSEKKEKKGRKTTNNSIILNP